MKQDKEFQVIKSIPLGNDKFIEKGTMITRTHGVYYMNGGMLSQAFQEDFDALIEKEQVTGWEYICPIVKKRAFGNSKETI